MSKFGAIPIQEYVSKGSSKPVLYSCHFYKLWRFKDTAKFISPSPKIVKRLQRRQYVLAIIERTIGHAWPFNSLVNYFPEALLSE